MHAVRTSPGFAGMHVYDARKDQSSPLLPWNPFKAIMLLPRLGSNLYQTCQAAANLAWLVTAQVCLKLDEGTVSMLSSPRAEQQLCLD